MFQIVQYLWQQFGPQAIQFINSPAFPELVRQLQRIPPYIYLQGGKAIYKVIFDWYQSLSPEEKRRLRDVMIWLGKNLAGGAAAAAIGLPIDPVIEPLVGKGIDLVFPKE